MVCVRLCALCRGGTGHYRRRRLRRTRPEGGSQKCFIWPDAIHASRSLRRYHICRPRSYDFGGGVPCLLILPLRLHLRKVAVLTRMYAAASVSRIYSSSRSLLLQYSGTPHAIFIMELPPFNEMESACSRRILHLRLLIAV